MQLSPCAAVYTGWRWRAEVRRVEGEASDAHVIWLHIPVCFRGMSSPALPMNLLYSPHTCWNTNVFRTAFFQKNLTGGGVKVALCHAEDDSSEPSCNSQAEEEVCPHGEKKKNFLHWISGWWLVLTAVGSSVSACLASYMLTSTR